MFKKFLVLIAISGLLSVVNAAEVTDVASSFDYKNPFDFNFDIRYLSSHHFGSIKREYNTMMDGAYADANGNLYYATSNRKVESKEYKGNPHLIYLQKIVLDAEIGLYHNLSLSFQLPVIISEQYKMIVHNASSNPGTSSLAGQQLFPWQGNLDYMHGKNLGDFSMGLQWAPFSEERKNHFMSWLLGINITFPTAPVKTPAGMNKLVQLSGLRHVVPSGVTGKTGDGLFRFDFRTAVSKKYLISKASSAEPYFQFMLSLPVNSSKSIYSDPKEAVVFNIGSDFNLWENKKHGQRVRLRGDVEVYYTNKGNAYSAIADARAVSDENWVSDPGNLASGYDWIFPSADDKNRNILPIEDPWVQISGMLKLSVKVCKYIELAGFAKFGYRHKHYLTNATPGKAGYIDGLDSEKTPWLGDGTKGRLGGRLLAEQYFVLDWGFNLKLLF
ncbi:MAG: hypothetical protein ACOX2F_06650 [bacterium]